MADFMCFGDYGNDYDMVREVGYGVAMDNAIEKVIEVAWNITKTNNENGVGVMINRVLDGEFERNDNRSRLDIWCKKTTVRNVEIIKTFFIVFVFLKKHLAKCWF